MVDLNIHAPEIDMVILVVHELQALKHDLWKTTQG